MFLRHARTAGLKVHAKGDRMVVSGPPELAWLADRLADRKAAVMAVLALEQDPVIARALELLDGMLVDLAARDRRAQERYLRQQRYAPFSRQYEIPAGTWV